MNWKRRNAVCAAWGMKAAERLCLEVDYEAPRGFSLVIGVANADEAERAFAGLVEGGKCS